MRLGRLAGLFAAAALMLTGCQSAPQATTSIPGDNSALSTMERVAVNAQRCWFSGSNAAFAGLQMSPELTSFSGRPRVLAVPAGNIAGLPRLVVEAHGDPAAISTYGPMMQGEAASRIQADVRAWSGGSNACGASA